MTVKISGILKDALARPLANVAIRFLSLKTNSNIVIGVDTDFRTANDGSYTVDVVSGTYGVLINFGSYEKIGEINVYNDSLPGTLEDFLTIPGIEEITPEILAQVIQARNDAVNAANKAASDATTIINEQLQNQKNEFDQFLLSSGYVFLGDYENGPYTITARNQIVRYQNELWRLNAATNPPYRTTGINSTSWTTDVTRLVSVGDANLRQELASPSGASKVGLSHGGTLDDAINWVTPEMFGAVGDGVVDDISAINLALATGKNVRMNPVATYAVSSSLIFPYTAHHQTLEGNGATIKATAHFVMFCQRSSDGNSMSDVLSNKNLFNIYGVGTAHAKSIYTKVAKSNFLKISNGTAMNLSAIGFCNGVSLMGNARVINVYADDIRNAAIRGEGENNFFLGLNAGFVAGDVVIIKSNYSYYGNLFCEYAGVSPTDTEEPDNIRDQGAMVSFAQDGQNAIGNIVDTCHCLNFGAAYAVFSGSYNKMTGSLYGGAFVENRRSKGAANAIYMSGTNNMIGDVYFDLVYSGIEMHSNAINCSIGYITIESKSGYGAYAISTNGYKNCFIRGLRVKSGLTKSDDAYLGSSETKIGELVLENFTQPISGGSPVRVVGSITIDRLFVSQATSAITTNINVTIQAAAHIRNLQIDGCLGTSLIVSDGVLPKLDTVTISPREESIAPPCIFYSADGTADRRIGMLSIRGGASVGRPRCNGTIRIGSYLGPSWAVNATGISASVIYADPVVHTLA